MPRGENSKFKPGHKLGAKKQYDRPLSKRTISIKVFEDQYDKLKAIPDLAQKFREMCDELIKREKLGG